MSRKDLYLNLCSDISGIYVEVGTCWGGFSDFLLDFTPCSKLYCVDPYKKFDKLEYFDALNLASQEFMDSKFFSVKEKLQDKFGNRVDFIRKTSVEAANEFEDNSLDFIYIDGNHKFQAVLDDLNAWYPKLRKDGILAGDDVEDLELEHLYENSALIHHEGGTFGLYGVHTALVEFQKIHSEFIFTLENNQFYWKKV